MKNLVLVNSKIFVSETPFSYTSTRSIYSAEERFEQTKKTINTIKQHIPDSYIVFVDNSDLSAIMKEYLIKEVDLFINPTDDVLLRQDTDLNPVKALGELAQVMHGLEYIDKLDFEWSNLFKLCGRYTLNTSFDYLKFDNMHNVFRIHQPITDSMTRRNRKLKTRKSWRTQLLEKLKSVMNFLFNIREYNSNQVLSKIKSGVNVESLIRKPNMPPITYESLTSYYTSFYKISRRNYNQYKEAVIKSYNLFKYDSRYSNEPLELVFCGRIDDKIVLDTIGLTIDCATKPWVEDL